MTGENKALWDRSLAVIGELNDKVAISKYITDCAPDLAATVGPAIENIVGNLYIPNYGINFNGVLPPRSNESPGKVRLGYHVNTTVFALLASPGKLYRVFAFIGDHTFTLNSSEPPFTPDQEVVIASSLGTGDRSLQSIREIDINPKEKTLKIMVDGEELPELMELYTQHRMLYAKKVRVERKLDLPASETAFTEEDQKEPDRLEAEINRITDDLSKTITIDRWSEGIGFIKDTLNHVETRFPEFNREAANKCGFDLEVLAPIVMEALNSYTPEIEIISWSSKNAMDDIMAWEKTESQSE
jgi:hypothetical protein